jgi:hypothetical protein
MDTPLDQPAAFDEPLTCPGDPTPLTSTQRCEWIHSLSYLINSCSAPVSYSNFRLYWSLLTGRMLLLTVNGIDQITRELSW